LRRITLTELQEASLNLVALGQFVFFTFLTCPPNVLWQQYLEEIFPGQFTDKDGSKSLHKVNTAKKFALDQTIGAVVNTVAFVAFFAAINGKDSMGVQRAVRRVWPLCSYS
jgi:protein Mpv17